MLAWVVVVMLVGKQKTKHSASFYRERRSY